MLSQVFGGGVEGASFSRPKRLANLAAKITPHMTALCNHLGHVCSNLHEDFHDGKSVFLDSCLAGGSGAPPHPGQRARKIWQRKLLPKAVLCDIHDYFYNATHFPPNRCLVGASGAALHPDQRARRSSSSKASLSTRSAPYRFQGLACLIYASIWPWLSPQKALSGGIPTSFLEPSCGSFSHFVGIYRSKSSKSPKNDV